MKKQWQLIRVLIKCGKIGKKEHKSSAVGDTASLLTFALGLALVVGMFFAGQYAAEHQALLGDVSSIFTTIMILSGIMAFFLTIMNVMNQLYISSDLDVLITLPFTPLQIVFGKLVSVSMMPAMICFGLTVPAAVGFQTKAADLSAMFIPSMVIGSLVMTVYIVSVAAILLMVIMRVFHFIRSRNVISVMSTLLIFALTAAYVSFETGSSQVSEDQMVGLFKAASGTMGRIGVAFPTAGFTMKAALGDVTSLLIAVAIGAAVLVLLAIAAKTLYFQAALGMTDANGKRGPVKDSTMRKLTAKSGVYPTLRGREIRQILRTPSLITNGYLYSIIFPFLVLIPMIVKGVDGLREAIEEQGLVFNLQTVLDLYNALNIPDGVLLMALSAILMFFISMSVSFSSLSRFIISREGKDFASLKAMPVSMRLLVRVKRNVCLLFNGISGFLLPAVLLIAAAATGFLPWWTCVLGIVTAFAWLLLFVNICAAADVRKPNLNWDNESVVTKNNMTGLVLFFVALAVLIGSIFLGLWMYDNHHEDLMTALGFAYMLIPIAAALVSEARLGKLSDHLEHM